MPERTQALEPPRGLNRQLRTRNRNRREKMAKASQVATLKFRQNDPPPLFAIEYVSLSDLQPTATKLRRLEQVHICEVAVSIATLGFCDQLLIGVDGRVIRGEARYGGSPGDCAPPASLSTSQRSTQFGRRGAVRFPGRPA